MTTATAASADSADGVVLCGGRGRRADGVDKGLLPVAGSRAVDIALAQLRPLCEQLYINANRNINEYAERGDATVFGDLRAGYPGPLAALEAAAQLPLAPLVLLLPVDMPLLAPAIPAALLQHMRRADAATDVVSASDGERIHYLCACVRSHCLRGAATVLDAGEHRVRAWLDNLRHETLEFQGEAAASLRNINSAAAWAELR